MSFAEYKPFVSALKSNQKTIRCDFCFKSLRERVECSGCHRYWYCNGICRNNDLITHRFECDPNLLLTQIIANKCSAPEITEESDWFKFKDSDEFVTQTLLLLRILFRLKADPNCATNEYPLGNGLSVSYDDISIPVTRRMHRVWDQNTTAEEQSFKADLIDDFSYNFGAWLSVVSDILQTDFMRSRLGSVCEDVLNKAFRIVVRYTLYVCDMSFLNEIGKAIYVEMCFISHSCLPNCGPLFQDSNCLNLRLLSDGITEFSQLKYDFQIEMTAYSAPQLAESLNIRSIECECKKCSNVNQFYVNYHKNVSNANLKYGNWPLFDYCEAMATPIDEALDYMSRTHDNCNSHPFITGLLLWKLRIEWKLLNSDEFKDTIRLQILEIFKRLKNSVWITHGSEHIWSIQLRSIEEHFKQFIESIDDSVNNLKLIDDTIEQIIPKSVIDQKIA